jgi:hypothetical protein
MGNPDTHPVLSRINSRLFQIFGKRYTHIQTAIHHSSGARTNFHSPHIDFPQKFFAYSENDTLQVWALLDAKGIRPEDEVLNLFSGFRPDSTKEFQDGHLQGLQRHTVSGMKIGDVLVFNSWSPHSTGVIDHEYERSAFKVHYFSENAVLDHAFLRNNMMAAARISSIPHNGCRPVLFAAEQRWGHTIEVMVRLSLFLNRAIWHRLVPAIVSRFGGSRRRSAVTKY